MKAALGIVALGAVLGAFTVGVLSRLAMFVLIRLNADADGVTSDDGFEMGRFTLSGSLNLVSFGLGVGLVSGLFYLVFERLRFGPDWFRTLSLSVGAGVAAASQVVHSDGVDFHLLGPLWVAVALFIAIPVLHIALLDLAATRLRARAGRPVVSWTHPVAWIARAGLVVVFGLAVASIVGDVSALTDTTY